MVNNQATTKMIKNIIDGVTPLSMAGYLNSIPVGGIEMFDRFVNVPAIAAGSWEQIEGAFLFFAGGGNRSFNRKRNRSRRSRWRNRAYAYG